MRRYNPKEIEPKWQQVWRDTNLYKVDMPRTVDKYYTIPFLPYPSGDLHIGHWYNYTGADTVARWHRLLGQNVFTTIGFDAFGLPAENAAIARGIHPAKWTHDNIQSMTQQLQKIGASYDWSHSINTSNPEFYRWNQWLFLQLYKKGLAYRAKAIVNWCPKDQTVLANEQVIGENNVCERCGTPVERKEMEQWFFKITDYADRLLSDLDSLDWPEPVKIMQKNWIGKSQGALIDFALQEPGEKITVFTTRPDTLFGATYMVLAPEHPLVEKLSSPQQKTEVEEYLKSAGRKTELERLEGEKEKTGVFTGSYAINPVNGQKIPIWVADYVIMSYGTGAIMAVPAHDHRDGQFAQKYKLPVTSVIEAEDLPYEGEGKIINSDSYDGLQSSQMREKIVADLAKKGIAREQVHYRLRDWLISRQRYWGTPIPVVYCEDDGLVPVPEDELPVILPEDAEFNPTGRNALLDREDFINTKCPKCGKPAKRETDTMDTFVDSSWYFLRYLDDHNDQAPFDVEIVNKWGPVDHYIGGVEHAILHLLYARFVTKFYHDYYQVAFVEPFKKLTNQGIITGPDGQKMSKRRGNVINPDEQITNYGTDSLRLYLLFMGPFDQGGPYSLTGIVGTRRFLDRVWTLVGEFLEKDQPSGSESPNSRALQAATHRTIKKVTKDIEGEAFNTALAALMEYVNELYKIKAKSGFSEGYWKEVITNLVVLMAPFAPHISEELWREMGNKQSVHVSKWPTWDENLVVAETMKLAIQINGKVRAEITLPTGASEAEVVKAAKRDEKVVQALGGKEPKKVIYVPGRLISLVVN